MNRLPACRLGRIHQRRSPWCRRTEPGPSWPLGDGEVYRLDTRFEKWTEFACTVVARNFTPEEWLAGFGDQPYRETCPP